MSGAAGGPTSVVAGRHRVRVAGLLHFMAAPVPRRVVVSRVPITLLPLLQHTDRDHMERVLQTFSLISKWIYGSWFWMVLVQVFTFGSDFSHLLQDL